jgi:NADH-ubiquinone oxidoreductase chain 4
MFLYFLLIVPIIGIFFISITHSYSGIDRALYIPIELDIANNHDKEGSKSKKPTHNIIMAKNGTENRGKKIALIASIINLIISLVIYLLFDFSYNEFQFVQEHIDLNFYNIYLGVDGISIYFILLTTIIMPIALISN